jgi:hypothetical protein
LKERWGFINCDLVYLSNTYCLFGIIPDIPNNIKLDSKSNTLLYMTNSIIKCTYPYKDSKITDKQLSLLHINRLFQRVIVNKTLILRWK